MPYIKKRKREELNEEFVKDVLPKTEGELNYLITMLCLSYLEFKGLSYATINTIMGAVECAKQEFYRRAAVPYEEKKIRGNGDIEGYNP